VGTRKIIKNVPKEDFGNEEDYKKRSQRGLRERDKKVIKYVPKQEFGNEI